MRRGLFRHPRPPHAPDLRGTARGACTRRRSASLAGCSNVVRSESGLHTIGDLPSHLSEIAVARAAPSAASWCRRSRASRSSRPASTDWSLGFGGVQAAGNQQRDRGAEQGAGAARQEPITGAVPQVRRQGRRRRRGGLVWRSVQNGPGVAAICGSCFAGRLSLPGFARRHAMTEFDFIIVGAGSAGCVLAARLTESGRPIACCCWRPAAATAGFWLQVPIGYGKSFYDPRVNWMYRTEPERGARQAARATGRAARCSAARARSTRWCMSAARPQISTTGRRAAIRAGAGTTCCRTSASPKTCRRRRRLARARRPVACRRRVARLHPLCEVYLRAGEEIGRAAQRRLQRRQSGRRRALPDRDAQRAAHVGGARLPAGPREAARNLRVEIHAHATRILFDGRRASAWISTAADGVARPRVRAREVILSAGAIRFAAAAAALRRRAGAALLSAARHRGRARQSGGRPQPAGPSVHRPPLPRRAGRR